MTLPTQVQLVSLAQFCERLGLRTRSGKPALRRARWIVLRHFKPALMDRGELWLTEQELARVCLSREAMNELCKPGNEYLTGRLGTHRAVMDVMQALISTGAIAVNLDKWSGPAVGEMTKERTAA